MSTRSIQNKNKSITNHNVMTNSITSILVVETCNDAVNKAIQEQSKNLQMKIKETVITFFYII